MDTGGRVWRKWRGSFSTLTSVGLHPVCCFFFSSRRRHTRFDCDWSSDVCSSDLATWRDRVRRFADSGYSTLLMPDFPQLQPAPGPTLALAAALTDLRVGTWVYASPLRPAWSTAWEAHSLSMLTEGRFEMGIGAGRPGIEDELRERGMPVVG